MKAFCIRCNDDKEMREPITTSEAKGWITYKGKCKSCGSNIYRVKDPDGNYSSYMEGLMMMLDTLSNPDPKKAEIALESFNYAVNKQQETP